MEDDLTTVPEDGDVTGGSVSGKQTGTESSLSTWAGDYVTDMLGKGWGLAESDYEAYTGPLTAGESDLQTNAFQGVANLTVPTADMGGFTANTFDATAAQNYMNPYLMSALNPQIEEARRQAEIQRIRDAGRLTKAGAFGGSRQAIMESEGNRNLLRNLGDITAEGYATAFDQARQQFNTEEDRRKAAQELTNLYGLSALKAQADLGGVQRDIEQAGIDADYAQFEEERDFPYKQVQYMQSLLQGLPLEAQSYSYEQPGVISELLGAGIGITDFYDLIFGGNGIFNNNDDSTATGNEVISESSGTADDLEQGGLE
jgi:hypothetical protein